MTNEESINVVSSASAIRLSMTLKPQTEVRIEPRIKVFTIGKYRKSIRK
jgi:hypothetical protein